MKVGAENKKKAAGAVALMAVAIFLFVRAVSAPDSPTGATSSVAARPTAASPQPTGAGKAPAARGDARSRHVAAVLTPTLDPRLRLDLLKQSEEIKYAGSGRNIFREHLEEIPKPVAGGLVTPTPPPPPPGPPPPPPINLKFYGWATAPGQAQAVFLARGEDVFIAHEGDIIARRYKVLRIMPNAVEIQDVLSNNTQSIPLTQS
jgi:hypothetical protein